ncbi:hypothetical protein mRhiFer1_008978 [Rhinolophus ferrumequinum]|uniref:Uncharacterized protein n=1 Tax=Rhinolophus ferrumequinum TaxID=59479 RepID=A0A7J7TDY3_RHIFE|nr:hypothetical protein mRhiFer1_008978 [Rhinolophus ferrumequinum]
MAAATFQGEIMQGHLMACQSHSPRKQGDPARTRFCWGPWTSTVPGDTTMLRGWSFLPSPSGRPPPASLQQGCCSENSSPFPALLCHTTFMKGDNAIKFYKSTPWLEFCSWLPTRLILSAITMSGCQNLTHVSLYLNSVHSTVPNRLCHGNTSLGSGFYCLPRPHQIYPQACHPLGRLLGPTDRTFL